MDTPAMGMDGDGKQPTQLRRRLAATALAAASVLGAVGLNAETASAHNSSYCGHGTSGYVDITIYASGSWFGDGGHDHLQYHDHLWGSDGYMWRQCGANYYHW